MENDCEILSLDSSTKHGMQKDVVPTISIADTCSVDSFSVFDAAADNDEEPDRFHLEVLCESGASICRKSPITVQEWVEHLPDSSGCGDSLDDKKTENGTESAKKEEESNEEIVDDEARARKLRFVQGTRENQRSLADLNRNNSLNSDASWTSKSSLEMVLGAREPDAEEILLNLGFGGSADVVSRLPDRFLKPSRLKGIDLEAFLQREKEAVETAEIGSLGYRGLTGPSNRRPSVIVEKMLDLLKTERRNSYSAKQSNRHSFIRQSWDVSAFSDDRSDMAAPSFLDRFRDVNGNLRRFSSTPRANDPTRKKETKLESDPSQDFDCDNEILAGQRGSGTQVILRRPSKNASFFMDEATLLDGSNAEETKIEVSCDSEILAGNIENDTKVVFRMPSETASSFMDLSEEKRPSAESSRVESSPPEAALPVPKTLFNPNFLSPDTNKEDLDGSKTPTAYEFRGHYFMAEELENVLRSSPEISEKLAENTASDEGDMQFHTPTSVALQSGEDLEVHAEAAQNNVSHDSCRQPDLHEANSVELKDHSLTGEASNGAKLLLPSKQQEKLNLPLDETKVEPLLKSPKTPTVHIKEVYSKEIRPYSYTEDTISKPKMSEKLVTPTSPRKFGAFTNFGSAPHSLDLLSGGNRVSDIGSSCVTKQEKPEVKSAERIANGYGSLHGVSRATRMETGKSFGRASLQRQHNVISNQSDDDQIESEHAPATTLAKDAVSSITKEVGETLVKIEQRLVQESVCLLSRIQDIDPQKNLSTCSTCQCFQRALEERLQNELVTQITVENAKVLDALEVNRKELMNVKKLLEVIAQKLDDLSS